ncbi:hypothetical protein [Methylibium petroleiphilum]|uniref:Transmembrane protein n=1 Tax=Methylibium petroleiphilum (strain ATCC BAA-1232 / LMG 22953 / PM1) TaxID=420662 RepID=A2SN39_METPP|nr:hypothetical protein [Methylibium petroleiphilum]ABM96978.1 hypothetical protein Mpe_B0203 [Methylibium petroleiphilum PM1]
MKIASAVESFCQQVNRASAPRRRLCTMIALAAIAAGLGVLLLVDAGWLQHLAITSAAAVASFALALRPWSVSWSRLRRGVVASDSLLQHLARSSRLPDEAKAAIAGRVQERGFVTIGFLADLDAQLRRAGRAARPGRREILRFASKGAGATAAA